MKFLLVFILILILLFLNEKQFKNEHFLNKHKNGLRHIGTLSLYKSAKKKNIKSKVDNNTTITLFKKNKPLLYHHGHFFYKNNKSLNSNDNLYKDKINQIKILEKNNIPIPKQYFNIKGKSKFFVINKLNKVIDQIEYPCVVKQSDGQKSKNVFINIKNKKNLLEKINKILDSNHFNIIIEKYIIGKNFRIFVIDDKVIDICYRGDVNIIGNGKDNITTLIDKKNKFLKSMNFYQIIVDKKFVFDKYKKNLNYIPFKGEELLLNPISIPIRGAIPKRIDLTKVHKENLEMFSKINKIFGLRYCGIDFITPDLSKSYKDISCSINELNTYSPSLELHYFADLKFSTIVTDNIIDLL